MKEDKIMECGRYTVNKVVEFKQAHLILRVGEVFQLAYTYMDDQVEIFVDGQSYIVDQNKIINSSTPTPCIKV